MMPQIKLKKGREKSLLRQHPWIFSGAVAEVTGVVEPGADCQVVSFQNEVLAIAGWSGQSQITGRVWSFDASEVIDTAFFRQRIAQAVALRRTLGVMSPQGGCRLIFSEADRLPGVIVDRFGAYLVLQLLSCSAEFHRAEIIEALVQELHPAAIFERSDAAVRRKENLPQRRGLVYGENWPQELIVEEQNCRFVADPRAGQKTGFYFDLRAARAKLVPYFAGRRVLNAFCYTGAFAVVALKNQAREVLNIDSSGPALAQLKRNYELNSLPWSESSAVEGDVFTELRRLVEAGEKFDLVILDPPKLIDRQGALMHGCRAYQDLARLGFKLLNPGGLLANFSCSGLMTPELFHKITAAAALEAGCPAQIIDQFRQAPDHPVALTAPESFYLKGLLSYRLV